MFGFLKSLFGKKEIYTNPPPSRFTPLCLHIFDADSPEEPRVVELRQQVNWIGVGQDMDVQVSSRKPDGSRGPVSRKHACIEWDVTGRWILRDESTNGTFVNGKDIRGRPERLPQREAEIRLGGREAAGVAVNYAVCPLLKTAPPGASASSIITPLRTDEFIPKPARLEFVNQTYEVFPTNGHFMIGTGKACDLSIPAVYTGVADKHLYVEFNDKRNIVTAEIRKDAANVFLNGERVKTKKFDWPWDGVVEIGTFRRASLTLRRPQN